MSQTISDALTNCGVLSNTTGIIVNVKNAADMFAADESFQIQMGFSFPFLRANDLCTSLLIMRSRSLSYVGLFINLIANTVNNNNQHVQSGTNVCMS